MSSSDRPRFRRAFRWSAESFNSSSSDRYARSSKAVLAVAAGQLFVWGDIVESCVLVTDKKVSWVLDANLEGFFDSINHSWLLKFLKHRVGDNRILRLIRKWLHAGVIEECVWTPGKEGSSQGSVISPILSNVFLHYVLDLWIVWWRKQSGRGNVVVVRYADDFVIGFEQSPA